MTDPEVSSSTMCVDLPTLRSSGAAVARRFGRLGTAARLSCTLVMAMLAWGEAAAQTLSQVLGQVQPQNVVSLRAEASTEVVQDLLTIVLAVTREGTDAAQVQSQLRQTLDAALIEARKAARPDQLEVRTGGFSLFPRYSNKPSGGNNITGWQGRAELVLEGRDIAGISQLAGRLPGMTVGQVSFSLSREARDRVEADVANQAIARFKARAERFAQAFGFASYSLREVSVGNTDVGFAGAPQQVRFAARAISAAPADESQPVEAGKATVTVSVSGTVQLSPR